MEYVVADDLMKSDFMDAIKIRMCINFNRTFSRRSGFFFLALQPQFGP
jgi:hypothetical protein